MLCDANIKYEIEAVSNHEAQAYEKMEAQDLIQDLRGSP